MTISPHLRTAAVALAVILAGLSACGRNSSRIDRASATSSTASTVPPTGSPVTPAAAGTSAAELTAAIDGVDTDLNDSESQAATASQGMAQEEGDPTK